MRGMGGFSGMTPAIYAELSDHQVLALLFAEVDEDGAVIPERELRGEGEPAGEPTGEPARAARELPTAESLGVPREALLLDVPAAYVIMFWQVWRRRGLATEEVAEKFYAHTGRRPGEGRR